MVLRRWVEASAKVRAVALGSRYLFASATATSRLDEELAEGRTAEVRGGGGQHDLRVARHLDLAHAIAVIGDGDPPHLDVVFGRDGDVERRRDAVIHAVERRALGREGHEILLRI